MKLFVSYPHKDTDKTQALVKALRSGGQEVWFDEQLRAGQKWQQQLRDAMQNSGGIVLALTPNWTASPYCQWEFVTAYELGKRVILVLLEKTDLPERISQYQYADFTAGFGDAAKVQQFLNDLLDLATKLSADDVRGLDKAAAEAQINSQVQTQAGRDTISHSGTGDIVMGDKVGRDINKNSPNIRIGGNVSGSMVNIGGNQTIYGNVQIGNMPMVGEDDRAQLKRLVEQLNAALAALPAHQKEDREAVEQLTQSALDEAAKAKPNKTLLKVTGEALEQAAKNLLTVAPIAVEIAKKLLMIA